MIILVLKADTIIFEDKNIHKKANSLQYYNYKLNTKVTMRQTSTQLTVHPRCTDFN